VRHTRIIVTHYGGPDALRVVEEECPEPKDGEVQVRVLAAGVSLPDLLMREGVHPETPRLPFTPGWDLIGVVDRLGAGVSTPQSKCNVHGGSRSFALLIDQRRKTERFEIGIGKPDCEALAFARRDQSAIS
jgi:NADPH:quinone reductase-like Zn-dependent oxidoreductase